MRLVRELLEHDSVETNSSNDYSFVLGLGRLLPNGQFISEYLTE